MYLSDLEAKKLIVSIGHKMSESRFVTANDGNLTVRVADDAIWATPTGVNKGELTEDMLIKVRISDGAILEGTWKPTCELQMHLNVYRTDDTIMSTAHAHPLNLSVFACAGIELDLPSCPAAACLSGRIPVAPYADFGSKKLAECVIPYVKDYHVINLANHGPIAWGKNPREAWYRLEDAEASAKLALELVKLGRLRPLSADQLDELFRVHNPGITEKSCLRRVETTTNQEPAIPFTEFFKDIIG